MTSVSARSLNYIVQILVLVTCTTLSQTFQFNLVILLIQMEYKRTVNQIMQFQYLFFEGLQQKELVQIKKPCIQTGVKIYNPRFRRITGVWKTLTLF